MLEPEQIIRLEDDAVVVLDQRRLPDEVVELPCRSAAEVAEAIRTLAVRGAPAIGVAAAYGYALAARSGEDLEAAEPRFLPVPSNRVRAHHRAGPGRSRLRHRFGQAPHHAPPVHITFAIVDGADAAHPPIQLPCPASLTYVADLLVHGNDLFALCGADEGYLVRLDPESGALKGDKVLVDSEGGLNSLLPLLLIGGCGSGGGGALGMGGESGSSNTLLLALAFSGGLGGKGR